jgi:hypothetical protein
MNVMKWNSFIQLTFCDLLEPGIKDRKSSIEMGDNERSKSRTSGYMNLKPNLASDVW